MSNEKYYDGNKLLNMLDINKNKPEILISNTNRSAGKTTYYTHFMIKRFFKKKEMFGFIVRNKNEIYDYWQGAFSSVEKLYYEDYEVMQKNQKDLLFSTLFIRKKDSDEWIKCGYIFQLKNVDALKKFSNLFSRVCNVLFDEFQTESNTYLQNEIKNFLSLKTSIGRGGGTQSRSIRFILCSNSCSLINPYFVELGISKRLKKNAKYIRGNGWVLERITNESAKLAQENSTFNKAFCHNSYLSYANENIYLDDKIFIEQMTGKNRYICTIKTENALYCVRYFYEKNIYYVDDSVDIDYPIRVVSSKELHDLDFILDKNTRFMILSLKGIFERGLFRFKDLIAKNAVIDMLS